MSMEILANLFNLSNPWIRWPLVILLAVAIKSAASILLGTGFDQWKIGALVGGIATIVLIGGMWFELRKTETDATGVPTDSAPTSQTERHD